MSDIFFNLALVTLGFVVPWAEKQRGIIRKILIVLYIGLVYLMLTTKDPNIFIILLALCFQEIKYHQQREFDGKSKVLKTQNQCASTIAKNKGLSVLLTSQRENQNKFVTKLSNILDFFTPFLLMVVSLAFFLVLQTFELSSKGSFSLQIPWRALAFLLGWIINLTFNEIKIFCQKKKH